MTIKAHPTLCQTMALAEPEEITVSLQMMGEAVRWVALLGAMQAPDRTFFMNFVREQTLSALKQWPGVSALPLDSEARVTGQVIEAVQYLLDLAESDAERGAKFKRKSGDG